MSRFPLYKFLLSFPLFKRGIKGDLEISPSPSFIKRGVSHSPFTKGRRKRDFIKSIPDFLYPLVLLLYKISPLISPFVKSLLLFSPFTNSSLNSPIFKFLLLFSPFSKGGQRGISRNLPQPLYHSRSPPVLPPICQEQNKGEFRVLVKGNCFISFCSNSTGVIYPNDECG